MKKTLVDLAKLFGLGVVAYLLVQGIRAGTWWAILICLVGLSMAAGHAEDWFEKFKELKKDVERLYERINTICEFFCESQVLKEEVAKFGDVDFVPRHRSFGTVEGEPKCTCWDFTGREAVRLDKNNFYSYLIERHPEDYRYEPDGAADYAEDQFRKHVREKILPIFEKLHKAEPKAFPKEHVGWLTRKEMENGTFGNYITWLIPHLERPALDPIKTPEGKAALEELKALLNPENPKGFFSRQDSVKTT